MFTSIRHIVEQNPEIINQFALVNWGGHQYAEGVTGVNYFDQVILAGPNIGFQKKGDCKRALSPKQLKEMTCQVNGKPNYGYGSVGAKWQRLKAFRISEILEKSKAEYFNWGYASLYCKYIKDGQLVDV